MVSSKCCAVVSPSPLRFLAALMPPCAHTECERFTGTIEKRSTLPPASAILITAASPASPPPTTMILGFVAMIRTYPFLLSRAHNTTPVRHPIYRVVRSLIVTPEEQRQAAVTELRPR